MIPLHKPLGLPVLVTQALLLNPFYRSENWDLGIGNLFKVTQVAKKWQSQEQKPVPPIHTKPLYYTASYCVLHSKTCKEILGKISFQKNIFRAHRKRPTPNHKGTTKDWPFAFSWGNNWNKNHSDELNNAHIHHCIHHCFPNTLAKRKHFLIWGFYGEN